MPVSDQHKDYDRYLPQWKVVRDCVAGSNTVKGEGTVYLPRPNPDDDSAENKERYNDYKTRANYVNFTGHTKKGMSGMVFRKDTKIELPAAIDYLEANANGAGLSLNQLIKDVLGEIQETGRYGFLVDYPEAEEGLTQAQVSTLNLQASILQYPAESILNWRTAVINGMRKLTLVVLAEPRESISDDGFSVTNETWYRVLRLDEGVYTQYLYDNNEDLYSSFTPRDHGGATFNEILFTFIGSQNNDESVDDAPLYDLAIINIAHYRNSADYEESSFMVGQPTPVLTGLTQGWVDQVMGGNMMLGSRGGIFLPEGGGALLLQASPNQMPQKGMQDKEQQMIRIGARLIQDSSGQETAEAAKIRFAGQNSELASIVGNIESAIKVSLAWVGWFMGTDEEAELEINRQFYDRSLEPQTIMAIIQLADRGDISQTDVRGALRQAGLIAQDKTDEDIDTETSESGAALVLTNEDPDTQASGEQIAENSQLTEILNRLVDAIQPNQTFIPAGEASPKQVTPTESTAASINVEAPIVNVTLPEGLIQLPENMVVVTVESPSIVVESPQVDAQTQVNNGQMDKVGELEVNDAGAFTGKFKLNVVKD